MNVINWLLEGDVSIQYQTYKYLLNLERTDLKNKIAEEGYGKLILDLQKSDGHWGGGYYVYKWINTHYSLMELRRLNINVNKKIIDISNEIANNYKTKDGGITPNPHLWDFSDVCINGMSLHYMCYFGVKIELLISVVDFIISQQLPDGGFNCNYNYKKYGAKHSSLHSTVSLIEGITTYLKKGYKYRANELKNIRDDSIEFILEHQLYLSDKTGKVINPKFTMLSYPPRWKYDILRALEAFVDSGIEYDKRMDKALKLIMKKRRSDGTWPVQNKHQGKTHFDMEKVGGPSRWNTLRILRVLKHFNLYNNVLEEVGI